MAVITNDRQYRMSKAQLRKLENTLEQSKAQGAKKVKSRLHRAMLDGMKSQIDELNEKIAEYGRLKKQKVRSITMNSLEEFPLVLMKARIAQELSQADLAQILKVKPQQIQRYESTGYQSVSFHRLLEIAKALGVEIQKNVRLDLKKR